MTNRVIQFVEDHPWGTAAGIVAVGLVLILIFASSSGSSAAAGGEDDSGADAAYYDAESQSIQAADQLQGQQLQLQAAANQYQSQLAAIQANDSTQVSVAQIQANANTGDTALQAQTTQLEAADQAQTDQLMSTLTAASNETQYNDTLQATLAGVQAQEQMNTNNNSTTVALQQLNDNVQEYNTYWNAATSWNTGVVDQNLQYMNDQALLAAVHGSSDMSNYQFNLNNANPVGTPTQITPINQIPGNSGLGGDLLSNDNGPLVSANGTGAAGTNTVPLPVQANVPVSNALQNMLQLMAPILSTQTAIPPGTTVIPVFPNTGIPVSTPGNSNSGSTSDTNPITGGWAFENT